MLYLSRLNGQKNEIDLKCPAANTWYSACGFLRPDGYLIWLDLVFSALLKKMFKSITKNYGVYTLNDIHSEFYKAGFKTVKKQKMVHGPFVHYEIVLTKS